MKCPNCQKENEPASHFCAYCGSPLGRSTTTQSEDERREERGKLTRKPMSDFRKALIFTAIPIVVLSLISLAGFIIVSLAATALWVIAIVAAIVFAVKGRRTTAAGIFAGIGIGIVALGATCFANLSLARYG